MSFKYNADNIKVLSKDEWFKHMVFDKFEPDLVYVLIGSLQEYFGGYSLHENIVDSYFVNEFEFAEVFKKICEKILAKAEMPNDVHLELHETGHSTLLSSNICTILKQYYSVKLPDFLSHKCYTLSKEDALFTQSDENKAFNQKQYSFLIGVFLKNSGQKEKVVFTNAVHKAEMTISFLNNFDAFGNHYFSVKYYFGVPRSTSIELDKNNLFWNALETFLKNICQ